MPIKPSVNRRCHFRNYLAQFFQRYLAYQAGCRGADEAPFSLPLAYNGSGKREVAPCSAITPPASSTTCSQEFQNKRLSATPDAVEDFLRLAAAQGFYIDDLIRMAESGMSDQQIAETVVSAFSLASVHHNE